MDRLSISVVDEIDTEASIEQRLDPSPSGKIPSNIGDRSEVLSDVKGKAESFRSSATPPA
jgi:hypothetical protein